jgi:LPXTG-site transpeptidase (sortase) family protein
VLTLLSLLVIGFAIRYYAQPAVQSHIKRLVLTETNDREPVLTEANGREPVGVTTIKLPPPLITVQHNQANSLVDSDGRDPSPPELSEQPSRLDTTYERNPQQTNQTQIAQPDTPPQLIIPSLQIMEAITDVPIREGQWDISQLHEQIGILETTGQYPGDDYAMTFVGHVAEPTTGNGPFSHLTTLRHGDTIVYRYGDTDYTYVIERLNWVSPSAVQMLYQPEGDKIILVTCTSWNVVEQDYTQRYIVQARLTQTTQTPGSNTAVSDSLARDN